MSLYRFGPKTSESVIKWLWGGLTLIILMIVVGGATRLTRSGLSIAQWKPFTGFIPPFSDASWHHEFSLYQQTPEYNLINKGMSLADFKFIFWMEFFHRLLGRLIGLYMMLPAIFFWVKNELSSRLKKNIILILVLFTGQGMLGWYMVKSGLVDVPHISHYRLSAHLLMAFLLMSVFLHLLYPYHTPKTTRTPSIRWGIINLCLIIATVFYGAMVAGLKAGFIYNTFPLMGNSVIPSEIFSLKPLWINFFENHATVQFTHRMLASMLLVFSFWGIIKKYASTFYFCIVCVQLCLGITTLVLEVPTSLGVLHQGWACFVFCVGFWEFLNQKHHKY